MSELVDQLERAIRAGDVREGLQAASALMDEAQAEISLDALSTAIDSNLAKLDEIRELRQALEVAECALMDARNGLDLGLGCARDLEGDDGPRASTPRAAMQEAHLERARAAHRQVREALAQARRREGTAAS